MCSSDRPKPANHNWRPCKMLYRGLRQSRQPSGTAELTLTAKRTMRFSVRSGIDLRSRQILWKTECYTTGQYLVKQSHAGPCIWQICQSAASRSSIICPDMSRLRSSIMHWGLARCVALAWSPQSSDSAHRSNEVLENGPKMSLGLPVITQNTNSEAYISQSL